MALLPAGVAGRPAVRAADARCPAGPSGSRAGAGARRSPATRAAAHAASQCWITAQRRFAVVEEGLVERAPSSRAKECPSAFTVTNVVQGHHQVVLALGHLHHADPQQRPALKVEGPVRSRCRRGSAGAGGCHGRARRSPASPCAGRHRRARCTGTPSTLKNVVRRVSWRCTRACLRPRSAPRPAARSGVPGRRRCRPGCPAPVARGTTCAAAVGQRHRLLAVDAADHAVAVGTSGGLGCCGPVREGLQFAGLEQRAQRQFDVAGLAGARDDARVASEELYRRAQSSREPTRGRPSTSLRSRRCAVAARSAARRARAAARPAPAAPASSLPLGPRASAPSASTLRRDHVPAVRLARRADAGSALGSASAPTAPV